MNGQFVIQWSWKAMPNGAVILVDADGHTVMDFVRKGMQACLPRFPSWPGIERGEPRNGQPGVMSVAQSWMDGSGQIAHPYARRIETAPTVCDALAFAIRFHDQLTPSDVARMRAVLERATGSAA